MQIEGMIQRGTIKVSKKVVFSSEGIILAASRLLR
jgi:hypothetical protein